MRSSKIAACFLAVIICAAIRAVAQDTNQPPTEFQCFMQQTNTIIVRGFTTTGTISLGNATVAINAQEGNDISHDLKKYAVTIVLADAEQEGHHGIPYVVDYDELDSLIGAIDYLGKITSGVSQLSGFDATYTTKCGFRVIAHSERRQGITNTFIQFCDNPRIAASSEQLSQLHNLLSQAKATIDGIK